MKRNILLLASLCLALSSCNEPQISKTENPPEGYIATYNFGDVFRFEDKDHTCFLWAGRNHAVGSISCTKN